jgi:predicted nucleic acid-binding Zn ribbon protein
MRSVGDLIGQVVKDSGLGKKNPLEPLQRAWREAVGRAAAESTRLKSFRGGTLTVEVDSAALAQELGVYHKRELVIRLRNETRLPLSDLRFRVVGTFS